jgi:hypothetical protein
MSESTGLVSGSTEDGVKDFTRQHERIRFRIDGDLFEAARALPGKTLTEFATRFETIGAMPVGAQVDAILDALGLVLLPDSAAAVAKRLGDLENPIELEQASEVMIWLLEKYGLRPTQPSSNSAGGPVSPVSGTNSTDVPQLPVPTSPTSPPTGS